MIKGTFNVFISLFLLSLGQSLGLGHCHLSRLRYSHFIFLDLKLLILIFMPSYFIFLLWYWGCFWYRNNIAMPEVNPLSFLGAM